MRSPGPSIRSFQKALRLGRVGVRRDVGAEEVAVVPVERKARRRVGAPRRLDDDVDHEARIGRAPGLGDGRSPPARSARRSRSSSRRPGRPRRPSRRASGRRGRCPGCRPRRRGRRRRRAGAACTRRRPRRSRGRARGGSSRGGGRSCRCRAPPSSARTAGGGPRPAGGRSACARCTPRSRPHRPGRRPGSAAPARSPRGGRARRRRERTQPPATSHSIGIPATTATTVRSLHPPAGERADERHRRRVHRQAADPDRRAVRNQLCGLLERPQLRLVPGASH